MSAADIARVRRLTPYLQAKLFQGRRERIGLTGQDVADRLGLGLSTVRQWENAVPNSRTGRPTRIPDSAWEALAGMEEAHAMDVLWFVVQLGGGKGSLPYPMSAEARAAYAEAWVRRIGMEMDEEEDR